MNQIVGHNNFLKSLYNKLSHQSDTIQLKEYVSLDAIDGVMRSLVSIEEMRDAGSFFTGDDLAAELENKFMHEISDDSIILDPTCGAGNLLLVCSRKLSVHSSLESTLRTWGKSLCGYDIYSHFVELTKLRLILEILRRGASIDCSLKKAMSYFKNIKTKDALLVKHGEIKDVTHAILNPPFSLWDHSNYEAFQKGKANAAGIVFVHLISILPKSCEISAILPEVLRSGSSYKRWRTFVSSYMTADVTIMGQFNWKTDVDVFILNGILTSNHNAILWINHNSLDNQPCLGDYYDISVGRLVAYRDPEIGDDYPYIHSKNVPIGGILDKFDERRKFRGTVLKPPFVVIRRTSRPSDKSRAIGTIIKGKEPVAVENHLIVIKPHKAPLRNCKRIVQILKSSETNEFLNNRIRCRHLTVGAIKQIPYQEL